MQLARWALVDLTTWFLGEWCVLTITWQASCRRLTQKDRFDPGLLPTWLPAGSVARSIVAPSTSVFRRHYISPSAPCHRRCVDLASDRVGAPHTIFLLMNIQTNSPSIKFRQSCNLGVDVLLGGAVCHVALQCISHEIFRSESCGRVPTREFVDCLLCRQLLHRQSA